MLNAYLPGVVGNVCKLFADDCKFNFKKCKIVSYGNCQFEYEYYMIDEQNNYHKLSNEDSECDLGVLFKSNLKFDEHIDNTINKVNRIIGLIKRKFKFIDKDLFLTLYKSLIRQCSHSRRIAHDSLGNCKNHAHFLGPKREFTHVFLSQNV